MNPFGCCCQLALKLLMYHSPPPPPPTHTHTHTDAPPPTWSCSFITGLPIPAPTCLLTQPFSLAEFSCVHVISCVIQNHLTIIIPVSSGAILELIVRFHMEIVHLYIVSHTYFLGKKFSAKWKEECCDHAICLLPGRGSASDWVTPTP